MLAAVAGLSVGFTLRCIHVDHGLRGEESAQDAAFVAGLCERLGVPCHVAHVKPGVIEALASDSGCGIEAAARHVRHSLLRAHAKELKASKILLAHTQDDALETFLMRLLRGAGPGGLALMCANSGVLLRPILALTRKDVISYLADKNLDFRTDSTNNNEQYLRNRVRARLIPTLDVGFPGWRESFLACAESQRAAADFIKDEAGVRLPLAGGRQDKAAFFAQAQIVREEALFLAWDRRAGFARQGGGWDEEPDAMPVAPVLSAPPKRAVLRRFAAGNAACVQSGGITLDARGAEVTMVLQAEGAGTASNEGRSGFALLIKTPGSYIMQKLRVKVLADGGAGGACAAGPQDGGVVFYAELPLLIRPATKGDGVPSARGVQARGGGKSRAGTGELAAQDKVGTAALICKRTGKVRCRRERHSGDVTVYIKTRV
jgi:tRNA(Ile)-lysidine synthase